MAHNCKNILITCIDFRLWEKVFEWLGKQRYLGDCDVVAVAGASKGIADNSEVGEVLMKQIDISVNLHKIQRVILLHYSDCGAYAKSYQFANADEEKKKQTEDMKKSAVIIKEKYPEVEIKLVWAEIVDGKGKEIKFLDVDME